jgi:hypothetical protein
MVESTPSVNAPASGSVSARKPPHAVAGAIAVLAALWATGVCLRETPTAAYSSCGTCSGAARDSLYHEAGWAVFTALAVAVVARSSTRGEFRVARSAAGVALVMWIIAIGFEQHWW